MFLKISHQTDGSFSHIITCPLGAGNARVSAFSLSGFSGAEEVPTDPTLSLELCLTCLQEVEKKEKKLVQGWLSFSKYIPRDEECLIRH